MRMFGRPEKQKRGDSYDFWISATELMSGVVLMFVLFAVAAMAQSQRATQEAEAVQQRLRDCDQGLQAAVARSEGLAKSLESARASLAAAVARASESEQMAASCEAAKEALVRQGNECLVLGNARLDVEKRLREFVRTQGLPADAPAGVLPIPADILFENGSSDLLADGKAVLAVLVPRFAALVVGDSVLRAAVHRVVVEGHSSKKGSEDFNMRLSTKRALAVDAFLRYELAPFPYQDQFLALSLPAGRGEMDSTSAIEDDPRDRRVDLRIEFALPSAMVQPAAPTTGR
jgi:outer membrane protein OmpA-like peptidoglycan-associated protein